MIGRALLDLHVLGREAGVPVAGWHPAWHYVWLRDSALAAVAFARTGHLRDAERIIDFLQRVQPESGALRGALSARRLRACPMGGPSSSTASAGRCGRWPRWPPAAGRRTGAPSSIATGRCWTVPLDGRAAAVATRAPCPPASPDYWEVPERRRRWPRRR